MSGSAKIMSRSGILKTEFYDYIGRADGEGRAEGENESYRAGICHFFSLFVSFYSRLV